MKLTKEQRDKLLQKLSALSPNYRCPLCGNSGFSTGDTILQLTEYTGNVITGDASICPVITAPCTKCGYTILISALASGVLTPDDLNSYQHPY